MMEISHAFKTDLQTTTLFGLHDDGWLSLKGADGGLWKRECEEISSSIREGEELILIMSTKFCPELPSR